MVLVLSLSKVPLCSSSIIGQSRWRKLRRAFTSIESSSSLSLAFSDFDCSIARSRTPLNDSIAVGFLTTSFCFKQGKSSATGGFFICDPMVVSFSLISSPTQRLSEYSLCVFLRWIPYMVSLFQRRCWLPTDLGCWQFYRVTCFFDYLKNRCWKRSEDFDYFPINRRWFFRRFAHSRASCASSYRS